MSSIGVSNMEELIGNQEFLSARNIDLPKTSNIDLSSLVNKHSTPDRSWLKHSKTAHSNGSVLEDEFLSDTEFIDSKISLNWKKRSYEFGIFYQPHNQAGGISFSLYGFK